jgi:hypothetical protein
MLVKKHALPFILICFCLSVSAQQILMQRITAKNTSILSYHITFDRVLLPFGFKDTVYQKNCHAYVFQTDTACYFRVVTPRNFSYIIDEPTGVYYYEIRNQTLFTYFKHRGLTNELFAPYFPSYYHFLEKECKLVHLREDSNLLTLSFTLKNPEPTVTSFTKELYINKSDSTVVGEAWYGEDQTMGRFYNNIRVKTITPFPHALDSILLKNQPITISKVKDKRQADKQVDSNDSLFINRKFKYTPFTSLRGKTVDLKSKKATYYVIDFSYLSCMPCLILHQHLAKENAYLAQKNIVVITLNGIDRDTSKMEAYLLHHQIPFDMYLCNPNMMKYYSLVSYPKVFILDKNFTIIKIFSGYSDSIIAYLKELP